MRVLNKLSLLLLLLSACGAGEAGDAAATSVLGALAGAPPGPGERTEEKLRADSCSGTVLVAEGKACVDHPPWRARRLFPEEVRGAGRLDRFCVFEWEGEGIPAPHQYPHADEPGAPEPDCLAVSTMAAAPAPLLSPQALESRFLEHIRARPELPAATSPAARPVQVSVIDTARELATPGEPGAGNAPHGRAMGLVIARLACPTGAGAGSTCAARIDNVPALRIVRTPAGLRRDADGGHWGYLNDIAWGIGLAVARKNARPHQILNLSFGWSREFGDVQDLKPHVRAVYDALRYARCQGALPIVAAGNTQGQRPPPEGPLVPGAWQAVAAPTAEECHRDFGLPGTLGGSGPLVFAVSAVDTFDRPLTTTPPRAQAPLAAPGLQVLVSDDHPPAGPPPVGPQTGSSAAAASVSALAAIAWMYRPELLPAEVMDAVATAGVELDAAADFCFPAGACPKVRRPSLCALVRAACEDGRCSPAPVCPSDQARGQSLSVPPLPASCAKTRAPLGCVEDPPEAVSNLRMLPLGDPQPDEDPCGSSCGLGAAMSPRFAFARRARAPAVLRLELPLNPNLSRYHFTAYRLWIRDDDTATRGWLQIDLRRRLPPDQPGGTTLRLDLDPGAEGIVGQIHSAQIDFTYEDRTMDGTPIHRLMGTPISVPAPAIPVPAPL